MAGGGRGPQAGPAPGVRTGGRRRVRGPGAGVEGGGKPAGTASRARARTDGRGRATRSDGSRPTTRSDDGLAATLSVHRERYPDLGATCLAWLCPDPPAHRDGEGPTDKQADPGAPLRLR